MKTPSFDRTLAAAATAANASTGERQRAAAEASLAEAPAWKRVSCPTCAAQPGSSCGRNAIGVPWLWQRTSPHSARKAAIAGATTVAAPAATGAR